LIHSPHAVLHSTSPIARLHAIRVEAEAIPYNAEMRPTPVLRRVVKSPVIQLKNASFYRTPPSSPDAIALFPQTNLELSSDVKSKESWAVVGASAAVRTDFLNALRGQFICDPPNARTYPYLATEKVAERDPRLRLPHHAIQYVGFDADRGQSSLRGSYLSQRYESKREIEDYTVRDFLLGKTALNADEDLLHMPSEHALETVVVDLRLGKLLDMPVSNLSNGQTRRSKIAKALLMRPEVLMLDSPFSA
jgi:ATPase subunit of ABC transporter with duplicated ATPase domains